MTKNYSIWADNVKEIRKWAEDRENKHVMSIGLMRAADDIETLKRALNDALEVIIWMSGSSDFSDGGEARTGFLKHKPIIDELVDLSNE